MQTKGCLNEGLSYCLLTVTLVSNFILLKPLIETSYQKNIWWHTEWNNTNKTRQIELSIATRHPMVQILTFSILHPGCSDDQGNCWRVGDQFRKSCNTYECRIEGTCYKIAEISKGEPSNVLHFTFCFTFTTCICTV